MADGVAEAEQDPSIDEVRASSAPQAQRGKTVHGEPANAGHRVLAPDDAEVEAYLETALNAPAPTRSTNDRPDTQSPTPSSFSTSAANLPS